jgi:hypothetical protein
MNILGMTGLDFALVFIIHSLFLCLRYFNAYMQFFVQHVKEQGIGPTIEEFVFAQNANLGPYPDKAGERQPQMLNRFFAGVLHPAIHTGYSAEFSLPGMLVEGIFCFIRVSLYIHLLDW